MVCNVRTTPVRPCYQGVLDLHVRIPSTTYILYVVSLIHMLSLKTIVILAMG